MSVFIFDNGALSRSALSQASGAALLCLRVALLGRDQVLSLTAIAKGRLVLVFWRHLQLAHSMRYACFLRRVAKVDVLLLGQVELLRPEHGARASDADPANEGLGIDLVVLHSIQSNKRTRAAEASLAVHCNSASTRSREVLFT